VNEIIKLLIILLKQGSITHYEIKSSVSEVYGNDEKSSSAIVFFNNIEKHFPTSTPEFDKTKGGYLLVVDIRIENISASSESKTYKITSTGKIGNQTRIVEKQFIVNWIPKNQFINPSDMALFMDTTIQLTGSAHIDGKIGKIHPYLIQLF
jgi:hypothetical protein